FVVQVWPGGQASSADVADDLALFDTHAGANALGEAVHVCVQGAIAVAVLDDHGVAVTAFATSFKHAAITGGLDRRTARRGIVDALVCADLVQNRVSAPQGKS